MVDVVHGVERIASVALRHGRLNVARGSVVAYTGAAIVNAANEGCLTGGGVDGAVTSAGGPSLAEARRALPRIQKPGGRGWIRCPTGDAKTTLAGDLKCKWVIHSVGPNYRMYESTGEADSLLYSAYRSAMLEAREKSAPDLALSLLSAGVFRGDRSLRDVLGIGALAVSAASYEGLQDAFLVCFTEQEVTTLSDLMDELFTTDDSGEAADRFLLRLSPQVRLLHQRAMDDAV